MGKNGVAVFFSAILDQILFILAGNDDIHKSFDEFEIRPDLIRDHRHGVQRTCRMISVDNFFAFLKLLVFAVLLLYMYVT